VSMTRDGSIFPEKKRSPLPNPRNQNNKLYKNGPLWYHINVFG
jgi:hypothetical protein